MKANPYLQFCPANFCPLCQVDNEQMQEMSKFDDSKKWLCIELESKRTIITTHLVSMFQAFQTTKPTHHLLFR
jgi:hypothetical protein